MSSNGCGPEWLPEWIKNLLFNWFHEASCDKHDEGYQKGGTEGYRAHCDWKFLDAMLRDSERYFWTRPIRVAQAYVYYFMVRKFGSSSFNYRKHDV